MPFQATLETEGKVQIPPDLLKSMGVNEGDIVSLEFAPMHGGARDLQAVETELAWTQEHKVALDTMKHYLPVWLENFKQNLPMFVHGANSFVDALPAEGWKRRCVVVANGPSLSDTDLSLLKDFDGTIVTVNKSLKPLLDSGVVPDWVTALDGGEVVLDSFKHDIVIDHADAMNYLVPTTLHPSVTEFIHDHAGPDRMYWANPHFSDEIAPNVSETLGNITNIPACEHGGNVGTFAYLLALRPLYCNPVGLLGFDMSYRPDPEWSLETAAKYRFFYIPEMDHYYALTTVFEYYLARLMDLWNFSTDKLGATTYNLTPVGPLNAVMGLPKKDLAEFLA